MSLANGTRIGAYEIVAAIGAGGMGEVYRARDTKLGREAAIKILPDPFASDRDRVAHGQAIVPPRTQARKHQAAPRRHRQGARRDQTAALTALSIVALLKRKMAGGVQSSQ